MLEDLSEHVSNMEHFEPIKDLDTLLKRYNLRGKERVILENFACDVYDLV